MKINIKRGFGWFCLLGFKCAENSDSILAHYHKFDLGLLSYTRLKRLKIEEFNFFCLDFGKKELFCFVLIVNIKNTELWIIYIVLL